MLARPCKCTNLPKMVCPVTCIFSRHVGFLCSRTSAKHSVACQKRAEVNGENQMKTSVRFKCQQGLNESPHLILRNHRKRMDRVMASAKTTDPTTAGTTTIGRPPMSSTASLFVELDTPVRSRQRAFNAHQIATPATCRHLQQLGLSWLVATSFWASLRSAHTILWH